MVKLAAHGAQQIHDEQIHTAAADLEAKGESSIGRQGIRHRRLPNPAALGRLPYEQAIAFKAIGNC